MSVIAFTQRDGSRELTCTDCGAHVQQAVDDGFAFPVCYVCRFLGEHPQIDEATKARLRGRVA